MFRRHNDEGESSSPVPVVSTRRQSTLSKRRVTRMVIVVVAVFAICWLPLHVTFVIQYITASTSTWLVVVKIPFTCLAYVNSCLNPFLYAFLSHNFQRSVARRLCAASQQGARYSVTFTLLFKVLFMSHATKHFNANVKSEYRNSAENIKPRLHQGNMLPSTCCVCHQLKLFCITLSW